MFWVKEYELYEFPFIVQLYEVPLSAIVEKDTFPLQAILVTSIVFIVSEIVIVGVLLYNVTLATLGIDEHPLSPIAVKVIDFISVFDVRVNVFVVFLFLSVSPSLKFQV